jgi:hypothetical protein
MVVYKNQNQLDVSNVAIIDGTLIKYQKGAHNHNMNYVDSGLTYFRREAFMPWANQSAFDLSVLCTNLCKNEQLGGFEVFERFYEIGSIRGVEEFSKHLRRTFREL